MKIGSGDFNGTAYSRSRKRLALAVCREPRAPVYRIHLDRRDNEGVYSAKDEGIKAFECSLTPPFLFEGGRTI